LVAEKYSEEVREHYSSLSSVEVMVLMGDKRKAFFKTYNKTTEKLIQNGALSEEVADFLYQADCGGKIDRKQANMIYKLIKNEDDSIKFGYTDKSDCTTLKNLKSILSDRTQVKWH